MKITGAGKYESKSTQKGSLIGSAKGSVEIEANKDIHISASQVSAKKDINLTGENVTITSKDNIYTSKEEHEYKRSSLSVSLGGGAISVLGDAAGVIQRGSEVNDDRLNALYGVQAYETLAKNKDILHNVNGSAMPGVSIECFVV